MPRLQHLRLDTSPDYGLHGLPIIAQCGLSALQSLDFPEQTFVNVFDSYRLLQEDDFDGSYRALFVNPRIRKLRMGRVSNTLIAMLIQDFFPSLEHLQVDMVQNSPASEIALSENWKLKTLRIECGGSPLVLVKASIQWMALTVLEYPIMRLYELPALLERMPRIKSVSHINACKNRHRDEIRSPGDDGLHEDVQPLRQKPWHLSLEQFGTPGMQTLPFRQSALFVLLPQMTNVTRLHLGKINRDIMKCIIDIPLSLLEELSLCARQDCSDELVTLVTTTCPRLRVLKGQGLAMAATKIFHKPWICTELRELQCSVVGIPRLTEQQEEVMAAGPPPDVKVEDRGKSEQDAWTPRHMKYSGLMKLQERSRHIQRRVFARFAQLRQLRILDIGDSRLVPAWRDSYKRCDNSLDFNLENGLDQLKSLQNLRVLGIGNLDHRMKEKEAEWMVKHWPDLCALKGCASKRWINATKNVPGARKTVPEADVIESLQRLVRRLKELKPSIVLYDNEHPQDY
ncbi:hypothetical protein EMPS_04790 [Entomortierella parvispora]|uniref:Uncharacterized protein n=1 Tax=Entomortierella parvispora TaxID=205924 RepID=A0A9P3H9P7_9FUNG|nr:hypothetical protein EMPS_04790 [Entomortierella parvispora]